MAKYSGTDNKDLDKSINVDENTNGKHFDETKTKKFYKKKLPIISSEADLAFQENLMGMNCTHRTCGRGKAYEPKMDKDFQINNNFKKGNKSEDIQESKQNYRGDGVPPVPAPRHSLKDGDNSEVNSNLQKNTKEYPQNSNSQKNEEGNTHNLECQRNNKGKSENQDNQKNFGGNKQKMDLQKNTNVKSQTDLNPEYDKTMKSKYTQEHEKLSLSNDSSKVPLSNITLNSGAQTQLGSICVTCRKVVHKGALNVHKGHEIQDLGKGTNTLKTKDFEMMNSIQSKLNQAVKDNIDNIDAINACKKFMLEPLHEVFKSQRTFCTENVNKLSKTSKNANGIKKKIESENFLEYFQTNSEFNRIGLEAEHILSEMEIKPFWMFANWFKATLGLMLDCGKKVFSTMETDGSKLAPVSLRGDRIFFSCFRTLDQSTLPKGSMYLPYDCFNSLLMKEEPCTYMTISHDNSEKGTVVLRIDRETFWGQQFITLCTGEKGPSYLNSIFFRSCLKKKEYGHHIWGGDYSNGDGSGGKSILPDDIPLVYNPKPIRKGLIAARFGYEDRSSIFRIYLSGFEDKTSAVKSFGAMSSGKDASHEDKYAFGHVEEGLDVLCHISDFKDITKSTISDVGRVLILS